MNSLKRYNEVAVRFQQIGNRKINEGDIIRTVSLTDRDAQVMNETEESKEARLVKYVLVEEKKAEKKADADKKDSKGQDEKELRATLFAKASELGLNLPKNTKTETLKAKVEEAESQK